MPFTLLPPFDIAGRLRALRQFLGPYRRLYSQPLLYAFPDALALYPAVWLDRLAAMSAQQLWQLQYKAGVGFLDDAGWRDFAGELQALCQLPNAILPATDSPDGRRMTPKKRHEVEHLTWLVNRIWRQHPFARIVDIGGGIGHLARSLRETTSADIVSIDHDGMLQHTGRDLAQQREAPDRLRFLNIVVPLPPAPVSSEICRLMAGDTLCLGLHTCGPLALALVRHATAAGARALFNIPCCYHKLDAATDCNLSAMAQQDPLPIDAMALDLTVRNHQEPSPQEMERHLRVNSYRYALQLLLREQYGQKNFQAAGHVPPALYRQPFAAYAQDRICAMGLDGADGGQQWQQFYDAPATQHLLRRTFAAQTIRRLLGRPLEVWLLADRALWMQELGWNVEMAQLFDPVVSPRNIGVWAWRG